MDRETKAKVSAFNKNSKFLIGKLIQPIEMAIHDFAVELLRGLKSAYVLDNEAEVERLKNETEAAIRAIQSYEGPEQEAAQDILVRQLTKLKHHDNIDTVVEGFVFQHDGQMYKFTGNFAPMNQLLGLFRYGRGKIPQMVKEMLREQNEGETVAILPGKFKPAHRGHLDMIEHYARLADRVVVLVSPKPRDGITAQTAAKILHIYLDDANLTNVDVEIPDAPSPVGAAMNYGKRPEMKGTKIILGASTKDGDAAERFAGNVQKYAEDAEVLNPLDYAFKPVGEVLHASHFREAIANGSDINKYLPDTSKDREQDIVDMVKKELTLKPKTIQKEANDPFLGIFRGLVDEVLEEGALDKFRQSRLINKTIKNLKSDKYLNIVPGEDRAKNMIRFPSGFVDQLNFADISEFAEFAKFVQKEVTVGGYEPKLEEIKNGILKSIKNKLLFAGEDEGPKTFQELYSILVYPEIKLYLHPWDFDNVNVVKDKLEKINQDQIKKRQKFLIDIKKDLSIPLPLEFIKTGNKEILNKASEEAIEKFVGSVAVSSTGGQGAVSSTEEEIKEIIEKTGEKKWTLYSKKKNPKTGKRKNLGTFSSIEAAKKREGQIEYFKSLEEEEIEETTVASAVAGAPSPVTQVRRRKLPENEVNEALNYLLQKLGV